MNAEKSDVQIQVSELKNGSRAAHKVWFLVKPIISAYVGRQIYSRVKRPSKRAR